MSVTPLFLDNVHKLSFTKIAMPVKLSDTPEAWQREIASEIFKQLPFIGDYAVNVILDRVDAERGYAFGSAHVTNKSQAPDPDQAELPSLRIPIIVKERLMTPLDVFMDGKGVFPLSAARVREHLFRTQTFESTTRKPSDRGLVDQLYPPMRTNYGLGTSGGVGAGGDGMGKMAGKQKESGLDAEAGRQKMLASMKADAARNPTAYGAKLASLIEAIAPTVPESEADAFVNEIVADPALTVAAKANQSFADLAMKVASAKRIPLHKTAEALVSRIKPTVVQLTKLASGDFLVKWANVGAFAPQQGQVPTQQASAMAGADLSGMAAGASMTVGTEKAQKGSLKEEPFLPILEAGVYKALSADTNEEVFGHVLPMVDFDMHPLELFLFTSAQGYAVQDQIAGVRQSDPQDTPPMLPVQQAQGDGVLVYDVSGKLHALLPMTVQNHAQTPEGASQIHGETMYGEPVVLHISPGLQGIQQIGEGEYAVPDFVQWMPLQGTTFTLAKTPLDVEQVQSGQAAPSTVDVKSTGKGEFSLDGQPVEKVAKSERHFLKTADAEFLLVGMGLDSYTAHAVLRRAEERGLAKAAGLRSITPLAYLHAEMTKKAAAILSEFPYDLRRNLVKEAAVLEDADTADKILAMNFLNPENVGIFASYLPELDTAACKLAEMLLAARLGLKQIDEGAVERAMKNLEQVIDGLKVLQQRDLV